jgi:hypothetical protein
VVVAEFALAAMTLSGVWAILTLASAMALIVVLTVLLALGAVMRLLVLC